MCGQGAQDLSGQTRATSAAELHLNLQLVRMAAFTGLDGFDQDFLNDCSWLPAPGSIHDRPDERCGRYPVDVDGLGQSRRSLETHTSMVLELAVMGNQDVDRCV